MLGIRPSLDVVRESAQNVVCLEVASGSKGQSLEADHGVAAPIGEPVVAGDHAANFVAGRARPGAIFRAAHRHEDELIGSPHQFAALLVTGAGMRLHQQAALAVLFGMPGLTGRKRAKHFPTFGGSN